MKAFHLISAAKLSERLGPLQSEQELKLIASHGVKIHSLSEIVSSLAKDRFVIGSASGGDIIDLIHMSSPTQERT